MTDALLLILIALQLWNNVRLEAIARRLPIIFLLVGASASHAQPKEGKIELRRLWTPAEAQAAAWADLQNIPANQRIFIRYLWNQVPSNEAVQSLSATLNRISRSALIFRPVPLADNRLVRIDLRSMVFDLKELQEVIDAWEFLRFDSAFSLLLTKDMLKVLLGVPKSQQPMARIKEQKGFRELPISDLDLNGVDVVRLNAGHLDQKTVVQLQLETLSAAPVVSREYFETRALNTIKDKGAYSTIFGGLYYEFAGVKTIKQVGKTKGTDEDLLFESLGIGDIDTGLTAQKIFDKRRSEQRVAMFRSDVTGKPRQIDFIPALNRRIGDGPNGVSITHDVRDEDIDASQHAIMTLRKAAFRDFAREVIWIRANGMNGYALYNAAGELQEAVPDNVAVDRTIPAPHTVRLQAASSCIRCHEGERSSGFRAVRNDVMTLLERGLDVFGDVSDPNRLIFETINELGSQFKGKPDKFIQQARFGYQSAMTEAVGTWKGGLPTDVVTNAAKEFERSYAAFNYDRVTPAMALRELGFDAVPAETAQAFLKRLLRPDPNIAVFGIIPEDPRLFALLNDIPVYRRDWFLIRPFAQVRANAELAKMRKP